MIRLCAWLSSVVRQLMKGRDDDADDGGMGIAINLDQSFDKPDDRKPKS